MKPLCVVLVNGVRHGLGDPANWINRAQTIIDLRWPEVTVRPFEYHTLATLRRLTIRKWTELLAETVHAYQSRYRVVLVTHSNGGELACRVLGLPHIRIKELHMLASAAEASFDLNGLNEALCEGRVKEVHCHCSPKDFVLRWVARASRVFRCFGLGYGQLGYYGPRDVAEDVASRVHCHKAPHRHSGYISPEQLPLTLERILT